MILWSALLKILQRVEEVNRQGRRKGYRSCVDLGELNAKIDDIAGTMGQLEKLGKSRR